MSRRISPGCAVTVKIGRRRVAARYQRELPDDRVRVVLETDGDRIEFLDAPWKDVEIPTHRRPNDEQPSDAAKVKKR